MSSWRPTKTKDKAGRNTRLSLSFPLSPKNRKDPVASVLNTDFIFGNGKRKRKETSRDLNFALKEYSPEVDLKRLNLHDLAFFLSSLATHP